jgi:hypothetical protein
MQLERSALNHGRSATANRIDGRIGPANARGATDGGADLIQIVPALHSRQIASDQCLTPMPQLLNRTLLIASADDARVATVSMGRMIVEMT